MLTPCRTRLPPARIATPKRRPIPTSTACYATIRGSRHTPLPEPEDPDPANNDFILSILRANPSLRDAYSYQSTFGPRPLPVRHAPAVLPDLTLPPLSTAVTNNLTKQQEPPKESPVITSILNPVCRRTALIKLQGPFTDRQLESIARGMVYLEKLGLVSVIVVDLDNWIKGQADEKTAVFDETMRVVSALEKQGARARPILGAAVRLGPKPDDEHGSEGDFNPPEAHTFPNDLVSIRSALRAGEIPVLPPIALDSFCRSVRIHSNDVIGALARGMVEAADKSGADSRRQQSDEHETADVDLTPLRLMIINREGGVPSYARSGYPHLLVNLTAEYSHIHDTFHESWLSTNPTSLSNLALARTCLAYMPPSSSAIMVSHRAPKSLIANLITNKPELSSSLPHALLQGNRKITPHTPTILRRGLPVRVIKTVAELDKSKMKALLEQSFQRTLDEGAFYARLEKRLDFAIVAGDYAGAAIVTNEPAPGGGGSPIAYLDKFAVLPSHQGDGTVDFLWVALHDESYGLGLSFSVNANGGKEGAGEGRDLVWRSRANNPINKWYFERSTGHVRMGNWIMFWCDAEKRLQTEEGRRGSAGLSYLEQWEKGRLGTWADIVTAVPSSWT